MIVLKKLTALNRIYPEASLGTQRRTILGNNSRKAGKKVAQAIGLGAAAKIGADGIDYIKENAVTPVLQSAKERLDSFRNNGSNGSNTGSSTTTTEVVTKTESTPLGRVNIFHYCTYYNN